MGSLRGYRTSWSWLTHIVVLTMALRALLPVGYMPSTAALQDGRFELVICTPSGPVTVDSRTLPGTDQPDTPDDHSSAADGICVFAAAAPLAPTPVGTTLSVPASTGGSAVAPVPDEPQHGSRHLRPAHPRGPPLSI